MCAITTKDVKPRKIRKPITVYVIREVFDNSIRSFYQTIFEWKLNELTVDPKFQPFKSETLIKEGSKITRGWFHSLPLHLAKKMYEHYSDSILFEAEIPAGSIVIDKNVVNDECSRAVNDKKVYLSNQLILKKDISYER